MSNIPFPQANDLDKVLQLIEKIHGQTNLKTLKLEGVSAYRQITYYCNAAEFLGYVELDNNNNHIKLTQKGMRVKKCDNEYRKDIFILENLRNPFINTLLVNQEVDEVLIEQYQSFKELSKATKRRRKSTILNWCKYLINGMFVSY